MINERSAAHLFALPYPEHLGATSWAHALGCGAAVFHRYFLRVFHFSLGLAFYAISFHRLSSLIVLIIDPFVPAGIADGWVNVSYFCNDEKIQKIGLCIACNNEFYTENI